MFPILYDLYWYDLAHVAGWNPNNLHAVVHVSWVGSVLCRYIDRSCKNLSQRQVRNYV